MFCDRDWKGGEAGAQHGTPGKPGPEGQRPYLVEPIAQAYNQGAVRRMQLFVASDARSGVLHVESKYMAFDVCNDMHRSRRVRGLAQTDNGRLVCKTSLGRNRYAV